jgi:hypothetical protein
MAGLGRKTFTAGDVLTASQVQGYLQDQTIMVFAGTAARASGIPSPSEGMFAVMTDTDQLTYYTGTDWTVVAPLNNPTIVDSTNYPNQIVNVNSGVSRPLPYAMSAGQQNISGTSVVTNASVSATITFTSSTRFTQSPVVIVSQTSLPSGSGNLVPKCTGITTTGFTAYFYNPGSTTLTWTNAQFSYVAVQMTSASATNN